MDPIKRILNAFRWHLALAPTWSHWCWASVPGTLAFTLTDRVGFNADAALLTGFLFTVAARYLIDRWTEDVTIATAEPSEKYSVNIHWSNEDESFIARSPEWPSLSAFGDTREEAAREMTMVLGLCCELQDEAGEPKPTPRTLKY